MLWLSVAVVAALDTCPKVWIIDFSPLPRNSPVDYSFTLHFELGNGKTGSLTHEAFKKSDPEPLRSAVYLSLIAQRGEWKVEKDGLNILITEAGGKPLRRVRVEGDGPKPEVHWVFAPPPKK